MPDDLIEFRTAHGRVTVLPSRGRILQAQVAGRDAFWVNPASDGGWNVGGDRLWMGPENDWMWQTTGPADFTRYAIPEAMDPGAWSLTETSATGCTMRNRGELAAVTSDRKVAFEVERQVRLIPDGETAQLFEAHLAYETTNTLRLVQSAAGATADLWTITQLPPGGQVLVGKEPLAKPRVYFGEMPASMVHPSERLIAFDITGDHMYKAGMAPNGVNGRMAYATRIEGGYFVVCRQFVPQSWRAYCDKPLVTDGEGDAVQVYNDGGDFGGFGEMEYHSPQAEAHDGVIGVQDSSLCVIGTVSEADWQAWRLWWL